ncbi:MAG: OmpA family protein [Epsilonproteobacteria bacterium]|nr:OmpA family protein [Campylobacterota bacterium]
MKKSATFLLLGLLAAGTLSAQEYKNSLSAMLGGYSPLDNEWVDDTFAVGARLGLIESDTHGLEVEWDFLTKTDVDPEAGTGKSYGNYVMASYLYHFAPQSEALRPYLIGGVGYETWTNGDLTDDGVAAVGAGVKYALNQTLHLRAEVRDVIRFDDGGNSLLYMVGLSVPFNAFGTSKSQASTAEPKETAVAPLGSLDADEDGVLDSRDKCPDTPMGTIVDENGCPMPKDSDGDGVVDGVDQCPNTPAGFKVDAQGCAVGVTLYLHFPFDSAVIPTDELTDVKKVAKFMQKHPQVTAELDGHTDSIGTEAYNMKLSIRRAKAVERALVKYGVSKDRLSVKGFGESRPIAPNDTEEGRAKNRRVEVILIPGEGQ